MFALLFSLFFGQQVIYHDIYIDQQIISKFYVYHKFSDGNAMELPIINGRSPDVTEIVQGPVIHRIFDYRRHVLYNQPKPDLKPKEPPTQPKLEKTYPRPIHWLKKKGYMKSLKEIPDLDEK